MKSCKLFFKTLIIFCILIAAIEAWGEDLTVKPDKSDNPIHIVSDDLSVDTKTKIAVFSGNVKAVQAGTTIVSKKLIIYYSKALAEKGLSKPPGGDSSVKKIVATGKVHINFDNRVADAEKAVYTSHDRVLVLTGKNSKITSEDSSISGDKIVVFRDGGRMTVEKGQGGQVEAILKPKGNGIN